MIMIIGVLSDTHDIEDNVIRYVIKSFLQRRVETFIHCGDIEKQHINPTLFGNLPVVCALNKEQLER
jgi:predicted phosphodiesterase